MMVMVIGVGNGDGGGIILPVMVMEGGVYCQASVVGADAWS